MKIQIVIKPRKRFPVGQAIKNQERKEPQMIEKEEIAYIIQEIKDHPEKPWNTPNKELAKAVFAQIREESPQATLCDAWINSWILLDDTQRRDLTEHLQQIEERRLEELGQLRASLDQLRTSEEERLRAWLDQKIAQMQGWCDTRDYTARIGICESRQNKIQFFEGIETVAKCLGEELSVRAWNDKEVLHFLYKGWEIMQIGRTEEN